MEHVELHHRLGHKLAISRPDFELYRHLLENGVISSDTWDRLVERSIGDSYNLQPLPGPLLTGRLPGSARPIIEL